MSNHTCKCRDTVSPAKRRKMTPEELRKFRSCYLTLKGLGFTEQEARAAANGLKTTFEPPIYIAWPDK
jgi:hypothetical protein